MTRRINLHRLRFLILFAAESLDVDSALSFTFLLASLLVSTETRVRTQTVSLVEVLLSKNISMAPRLLPLVVYRLERYSKVFPS